MSVGRKKLAVCQDNVAAFSCCCKVLQYQQTICENFLYKFGLLSLVLTGSLSECALEGLSVEFTTAGILTMQIFKRMVLTESSDEPRKLKEKLCFENSLALKKN